MIFYKYCASGNDFVVFADKADEANRDKKSIDKASIDKMNAGKAMIGKKDRSELAKVLCDRHSGIGADGLIVILGASDESRNNANDENSANNENSVSDERGKNDKNSASNERANHNESNANLKSRSNDENSAHSTKQSSQKPQKYDFEWDFYNCDGSVPSMCGNGARVAAHFAVNFLGKNPNLSFLTKAGVIKARVEQNLVEISLGEVKDEKAPFEFAGKIWQGCNTGVPHLVHFCEDLAEFDATLCQKVRQKFNANVNFAQIVSPTLLKVRTYERGVEGETLACGTGMAASFYLAHKNKALQDSVLVQPKSGEKLYLRYENGQIFFKGEVRCCFEAKYHFS